MRKDRGPLLEATAAALARLPPLDLAGYGVADLRKDALAAAVVVLTGIPTGIAYAMIAGLPPVAGLYASLLPAVVGGLLRSSRHVIVGPTNALSLLVGAALAAVAGVDPLTAAVTLACMVGVLQVAAGVMGLGALVDFVSRPVVYGYITGAAALIVVGQLPNLTATERGGAGVLGHIGHWAASLPDVHPTSLALSLGTVVILIGLRRLAPRIPGPILALAGATAVSWWLDLEAVGVAVVADLSPVPASLPPLTLPDLGLVSMLAPVAVAITALSLIESSAVARSISSRTGQALDTAADFVGQGLANLAAGFTGGYPVSGSLGRSALNERSGAVSRLSGVLSGILMAVVLLVLGPVVDHTPIAALAGLLLVVAWDLLEWPRIRFILGSRWSDRLAFAATLLGTWILRLDHAIYLGVGVSLVFFLRQARLLLFRELVVSPAGRLREVDLVPGEPVAGRCEAVRVVQVEGRLFFGVEGELRSALASLSADPRVRVLVLRIKRTQGMDATVAGVIQEEAARLASEGRHLILVGMRPATMELLERTGVVASVGADHLYPTGPQWFAATHRAIERALEEVGPHGPCPLNDLLSAASAAQGAEAEGPGVASIPQPSA